MNTQNFLAKSLIVFFLMGVFMTFFYPKYELKERYNSNGKTYHVQHNKITGNLKRLGDGSY